MKKLLSILLVAVMMLSLVPALYAADGEPFYHYVSGLQNSYSVNRQGQAKVIVMGNNAVWGSTTWGENPEVKTEKTVSATDIGNEGILPASGGISGNTTVYWIKSAVFPTDDTESVKNASSGTFIPIKTGTGNTRVRSVHSDTETIACAVPHTLTGSVAYEIKVRFDDYNARRYILTPGNGSSNFMHILKFETDGNFYANIGGTDTAIATYTPGVWYNVKFVYHFTNSKDDNEYFDVSLNGTQLLKHAKSKWDITGNGMTIMNFMLVEHLKEQSEVTQREFSNSYMYEVKAYTTDSIVWPLVDSDFTTATVTNNGNTSVGRSGNYGDNGDYCYFSRTIPTESGTGYDYSATIPGGFDGLDRVYMLQSKKDGIKLLLGASVPLANPLYPNVVLETRIRMDDKNFTRKVFELDASDWFDIVKFAPGGIFIDYMSNGVKLSKNIGEWTAGKWYNVKAVLHNTGNLYDLYIDDVLVAKDMYLGVGLTSIEKVYFLCHESGDVSATSTSYIQYAKAYYDTESTYVNPPSHINVSGFKKLNTESNVYEDAMELSEGKFALQLDILNNEKGTELTPTVILAYYKGDRLVSVDMQSYKAEYPSKIERTFSVDTKFTGAGEYTLKAFMWKDGTIEPMDTVMPAAISKTITE